MIRPQIVLCVPGHWKRAPRLDPAFQCELQLESDPRMTNSFQVASSRVDPSLTRKDLADIAEHTSVLYVLSGNYGPEDAAEKAHRMMQLGRTLLDAQGVAVKCESSGLAHSAKRWRALTKQADAGLAALGRARSEERKLPARVRFWLALRRAFVFSPLLSDDERDLYTCGMHLLGRRDAITRRRNRDLRTHELLAAFSDYVLSECADDAPRTGEGFRRTKSAPRWRIAAEPCRRYPEDDFFHNPYGYFRLR